MASTSPFTLSRNAVLFEELKKQTKSEIQQNYWKWFLLLSEIPRPSYHCNAFADWLVSQAKKFNMKYSRDEMSNVCIHIPASPGFEKSPAVILQAHMDMVATCVDNKTFNFVDTPITVLLNGSTLTADGTTLGADDGAGLACLLSLMEDNSKFKHAAIEALFTVDEEPGLLGALALKEGELFESAKYLINVDSEEWGEVTISSAGCAQRKFTIPVSKKETTGNRVTISLEGLRGGHSGAEIHAGRANALKMVVEALLMNDPRKQQIRIEEFTSGHTDNAIPMKGFCKVFVENGEVFKVDIEKALVAWKTLYGCVEENIKFNVTVENNVNGNVMSVVDSANLLLLLKSIPHGVVRFSSDVEGLTETSTSLSICNVADTCEIVTLSRSADNQYLDSLVVSIEKLAKLHGAKIEIPTPDIGGWPAMPNCNLLNKLKESYKELYGKEIIVSACHGGLENSIILNQYPNMKLESISIGPTCKDVHTPDEILDVESGNMLLDLLFNLLEKLI
ncbi:Aminoacyl-histidine dipeptidase [Entamoeba marina]